MVKVYYGNDYKEAMYGAPIYTNNASQLVGLQKNYQFVTVEEITYEDIKEHMTDELRIQLYKEVTGVTIKHVGPRFWDWVEENYEATSNG